MPDLLQGNSLGHNGAPFINKVLGQNFDIATMRNKENGAEALVQRIADKAGPNGVDPLNHGAVGLAVIGHGLAGGGHALFRSHNGHGLELAEGALPQVTRENNSGVGVPIVSVAGDAAAAAAAGAVQNVGRGFSAAVQVA